MRRRSQAKTATRDSWAWAPLAFLLLVLSALALSSCNTMQGAGEDVSAAGNALQRGAAEHNPEKQPAN